MKKKYNDCKKKYTKNYDSRQKRKQYQMEYVNQQIDHEYLNELFKTSLTKILSNYLKV